MTPTRRTVLAWLLAAVIAPPRVGQVVEYPEADELGWILKHCLGDGSTRPIGPHYEHTFRRAQGFNTIEAAVAALMEEQNA